MAIALTLAAAVSVPFLWEWAETLWQTPAVTATPPADSTQLSEPPVVKSGSLLDDTEEALTDTRISVPAPSRKYNSPENNELPKAKKEEVIQSALSPDQPASIEENLEKQEIKTPKQPNSLNKEEALHVIETPKEDVQPVSQPVENQILDGALPPLAVIETQVPVTLDYTGSKIVRSSLRLINRSAGRFSGKLSIKAPRGIKSISGDLVSVTMSEGDTLFVPVVFMMGGTVSAGDNEIDYTLMDIYGREVEKGSTKIPVNERVSLQLNLDQPLIMITNLNDSLTVSARVNNRGNTDQLVTVVMAVPLSRGGKSFYELRGEVRAGYDSLFVLKIRPAQIEWNEGSIAYVNISGLYGPEKQTFGNVTLGIQSVVTSGRYVDSNFGSAMLYDNYYVPEDITLSYRRFGQSSIYQVMGGGHINLPVGNLAVQGLIYKVDQQDEIFALNTQVAYRYNNSSLAIGNINEQLEYSTFGRGVKAVVSDKSGKNTLKVGVVDNQFNLFSSRPLFENGYSVFVKDHIGTPNAGENMTLDYMFREDPWEKAKHHMAGGEWKWNKGTDWRILLRSHGALSDYTGKNGLVPSGSAEVLYSGSVNKNSVSGNYYYSTAFFPGNRRGTINLQQNYNRQLSRGAGLRANAFWSNFAPKSYHHNMDVESSNGRLEGVYTFPRIGKTGLGMGYQYQTESANLAFLPNNELGESRVLTHAHRLVENVNWRGGKHYVNLGIENGVVKPFNKTSWEPQGRALLFYGLGRFNLNTIYQHGGYYLSEQSFAAQLEKVTRRLMANASWNQEFFRQDLMTSAGVNYSRDFIMGSTWSGTLNTRYRVNKRYSVFLNSVVYNYAYSKDIALSSYNSTMYNIEGGVSLNLNQAPPATGKKSRLTLTVFHDKNGNGVQDSDESPAPDYMIFLGEKIFITDEKGRISYTAIPFGSYTIKAGAQAGWFHTETIVRINGFKESVAIPLRQAGSVQGSIRYSFDERTAKDFIPVLGGVSLRFFRNGEQVQRAVTDNDGRFIVFLPNGQYTVELEIGALDANASVQNKIQTFNVEAGHIATIAPFVVEIHAKKINIRQFVQNSP